MRKVFGVVLAGMMALSTFGGVTAQDQGSAIVTISSDGLRTATIEDATFTPVEYSFTDETATASIVVNVEDNTGSGAGWNVTLYGTAFERDTNTSFPVSNLVLGTGTAESTSGQAATGITATGITVGTASPGEKIASAALLSGMGHYTITYVGTLTVPGGTMVGQYESTLTVTITASP